MKHSRHTLIYRSRMHLTATIGVLLVPFIFFVIFARVIGIPIEKLFSDIGISFLRLSIAYVISVVLAWILAVFFYEGRRSSVALPIFDVLQSFPTFAALPLAVVLWGVSDVTVIIFLVFTIIWPIFFTILSSLKLIRRDWKEAVDMSGLSGFSYVRRFLFPITIPGLVTGTIIGLGEGWEALVATEIIVNIKNGLGQFFQTFSHNPTITAFGILGFLILIFSINKLLWLPLLEWGHKQVED